MSHLYQRPVQPLPRNLFINWLALFIPGYWKQLHIKAALVLLIFPSSTTTTCLTYIFLEFPFLCLEFFLRFLESFSCSLEPLHLVFKPHDLQTNFTRYTLSRPTSSVLFLQHLLLTALCNRSCPSLVKQQIHARQFCLTLSVINNLSAEWFTYIVDMSALSNTYISFKCCYFLLSTLQLQLVFTQFFLCVACNNSSILFYFIYQVMGYFNCSWHLL